MMAPRTKQRQTVLTLLTFFLTGLQGAVAGTVPAQLITSAPAISAPAISAPATPAFALELTAGAEPLDGSDLLAVVGSGPGALRVTRANFDQAFRLAVGEVLGRQGLPLGDDLLAGFDSARPQFFEQFLHDKQVEYLARRALPDLAASLPVSGVAGARAPGAGTEIQTEASRRALTDAYRRQLQQRFAFSDEAVSSFYMLNQADFTQREEACARHMLLTTQAEAEEAREAVIGGADFTQWAQRWSRDPSSAARGGALGCWAPGETVPAFDGVLFRAALGVPQVVQTDHGWHVLEVTERRSAGLISLAQAAPQIRDLLARRAAARLLDAQLERVPVQAFPERL